MSLFGFAVEESASLAMDAQTMVNIVTMNDMTCIICALTMTLMFVAMIMMTLLLLLMMLVQDDDTMCHMAS